MRTRRPHVEDVLANVSIPIGTLRTRSADGGSDCLPMAWRRRAPSNIELLTTITRQSRFRKINAAEVIVRR